MLISFDLEGTLVSGELFPALGERLGCGRELGALTRAAMEGLLPFEEALRRRTSLIKGASIRPVREVADSLPLAQGAEETVEAAREMGYTPAIITGGFDLLANRVARELGVNYVLCNRFTVNNGIVDGVAPPMVTPQTKVDHMLGLCDALGVPPEGSVAVGDGANDIPMLRAAGLGIAFNAREVVRKAVDVSVDGPDLRNILPHIPPLAVSEGLSWTAG